MVARHDRARNRDGVRRGQRIELILRSRYHSAVAACGARPRAVIGCDLALAFGLEQREAIAADPGGLRLDHPSSAQAATAASAAVPRTQHLDRRQRGQRMRGCHHSVLGVDRGPAGEMEVSHAKLLTFIVIVALQARAYMAHSGTDGNAQDA